MTSRRKIVAGLALQAALGSMPRWVHGRNGRNPGGLQQLAARLTGQLLTPVSAGYDLERRTFSFNPRTDRHPAAIALCASADDVARCIEFARSRRVELAVRCGGHDVLASSTCDNGLVIDLGRMSSIRRGQSADSVIVGGGARAGAILQALAHHGRAIPIGDYGHVGIGGLALGGGLGPLIASHGATCDSLLRARVVTADGRHLTASGEENPELFWALRGGGGNFGVVTEFEFATHQVPQAVGGMVAYDGAHLVDLLRFYADYMARAPRELAVELRVLATDRLTVLFIVCFIGNAGEAERTLAPLRTVAPVLADGLRVVPFVAAGTPTPAVVAALSRGDPQMQQWDRAPAFYWLGGSTIGMSEAVIKSVVDSVESAPATGWGISFGHHMHGAVCDVDSDLSPLPRPHNQLSYHFDAWWQHPGQAKAAFEWVDASAAAMAPHAAPAYINYLSTDQAASIAASYGPTFSRLRALKRRYDPENVFHRNRNIPPA